MARKRHRQIHDPVQSLSARITDRIPLELYETIIDSLAHDLRTLSDCALVCRAWLPRSRLHLFHDIVVCLRNFDQFLMLLNSQDFGAHVRSQAHRITIDRGSWANGDWIYPCMPCWAGFHINSLVIRGFVFSTTSPLGVAANFQSVTELILDSTIFISLAQVLEAMCILRNLERLSFVCLDVIPERTHAGPQTPAYYSLPPRLQILELQFFSSYRLHDTVHWLSKHSTLPRIHTLSLCTVPEIQSLTFKDDSIPSLAKVLTEIGTALHHLTISRLDMVGQDLLSFNTELRTLHVKDLFLPTYIHDGSYPRMLMPPIAGKVASVNLHQVTFGIRLYAIEELDNLDWEGMSKEFSRPEFAHLDRINFHVSALKKEATRRIRTGLPDCTDRGIVRVSQPVPPKQKRLCL